MLKEIDDFFNGLNYFEFLYAQFFVNLKYSVEFLYE